MKAGLGGKIYLECTCTYTADIITGIQRVVRQICLEAPGLAVEKGYEAVPVIIRRGQLLPVPAIPELIPPLNLLIAAGGGLRRSPMVRGIKEILRSHAPSLLEGLQAAYTGFKYHRQLAARSRGEKPRQICPGPDDILFMLDATWLLPDWQEVVQKAKNGGATVIFATYDLIPHSHAHFFDAPTVKLFEDYYRQVIGAADGFITISQTVREQLREYIQRELPERARKPALDYYYPGVDRIADDCLVTTSERIRPEVRRWLSSNPASYLIVGTIEPRKNHRYLLEAFDRLWPKAPLASLIIIGQQGWRVGELMATLRKHPQLGKRLAIWHDLNDAELQYCYRHARALLFPSIIEGLGLPIIEALRQELPVIASDTPINREIGRDCIQYVPLNEPGELVNIINRIEEHGVAAKYRPTNFPWLDGREATSCLLDKLIAMACRTDMEPQTACKIRCP